MTTTKNKIALVTGGSRGLGKDMAISIAKRQMDVILTYHSNQAKAEEVVAEIEKLGQKAWAYQLDTTQLSSFDGFLEQVGQDLKAATGQAKFDALINNAGVGTYALVAQTSEEQFDLAMNMHFKGVYFLTQKALPYLNDGGSIINISSGLTRFVFPGYAAYAAAKGAIEVFTKYLAKELGARGINANVVAPGAIETDFGGGMVRDNEELNQQIASITALGRAGLPEDIGGVVAFLCTTDGHWINAQRIEVSGGMSL